MNPLEAIQNVRSMHSALPPCPLTFPQNLSSHIVHTASTFFFLIWLTRQIVVDPLVFFVACKVHHPSRDVIGSVIWCSCAFASLPCFKSLGLGCDGIVYFLIPPPSFTSPPVGLCCLQQTCFSFTQISSVIVATSVSTAGTCALKTS